MMGDEIASEFKSTHEVADKHIKGLRAFTEEQLARRRIVVSQDERPRKTADGIETLPWLNFSQAASFFG